MQVQELIQILQKCPQDAHVLFSINESDDVYRMVRRVLKKPLFFETEGCNEWNPMYDDNDDEPLSKDKAMLQNPKAKNCIVLLPYSEMK